MNDAQKAEYLRNTEVNFEGFGINSLITEIWKNMKARRDAELKVSRPEVKQQQR